MSPTKLLPTLATTFALATPAMAEPTLGLGLSFSFGGVVGTKAPQAAPDDCGNPAGCGG